MKHITIINSHSPYQSSHGQESLDLAMVAGTFGQKVSLLFIGDGVFQLLAKQNGQPIARKTLSKNLAALEFYDVEDIYVCQHSMQQRYVSDSEFHLDIKQVTTTEIQQLLANCDQVIKF